MQAHRGEVPDEVVLHLRQSKTDQHRAGATRNHYCATEEDYCLVRVLWLLRTEGPPGGPGA
eukprot:25699-Eustigmatos_ZCMA.PRE.1